MSINNLFKPSVLKELCAEYGFSPNKKYGQNYLVSPGIIEKIKIAAQADPADTIIEIGPGFGVLTLALAPLVKKIIAFEIEKKLQLYWEQKIQEYPNVELIWGNALKELPAYVSQLPASYKVVANLPYQITSFALRTLLELSPRPERIVVMVQKEVAERMVAPAGDMSLLSVSVQFYGVPRIVAHVASGSFWPAPKVDSAIVAIEHLTSHPNPDDVDHFFSVVRAGFAHKRKQLWHNITDVLPFPPERVKEVLKIVVKNEKIRAEELSLEDWKKITALLYT